MLKKYQSPFVSTTDFNLTFREWKVRVARTGWTFAIEPGWPATAGSSLWCADERDSDFPESNQLLKWYRSDVSISDR